MTCDDVRSSYLAGETSPEEAGHLTSCPECRRSTNRLDEMRALLAGPEVWESPRAGLEDDVVAALSHAVAGEPTPGAGEQLRPRKQRPPWAWLGAAAVLVAVGIAVGSLGADRPDWQMRVPGTDMAPHASAVVEGWDVPAGTRLRVSMSGLPPAPDGYAYEMWLTQDRVHVSGGTFVQANRLEMVVGVRQEDYPRIWITLEKLDGDTSPTWERNLIDTGA